MKDHKRWSPFALVLPRAMRKHLNSRRRMKEPRLGSLVEVLEPSWDQRSRKRLRMRVPKFWRRNKRRSLKMLEYAIFRHCVG